MADSIYSLTDEELKRCVDLVNKNFVLTKFAAKAYKYHGYEQLFLVGAQGKGKTTYAQQSMFQLFYAIITKSGTEPDQVKVIDSAWEMVQTFTIFNPDHSLDNYPCFYDLFDKALETAVRIYMTLFDDAGLHLSKYLWSVGDKQEKLRIMLLNGIFNMIREGLATSVFTSPDDDILKEMRKKSWLTGQPKAPEGTGPDYPTRTVALYRKDLCEWDVNMKPYSKGVGEDNYTLWLPESFRARYLDRKRREARAALKELRKIASEIQKDLENPVTDDARRLMMHKEIVDFSVVDRNGVLSIAKIAATLGLSGQHILNQKAAHNSYVETHGECPDCVLVQGQFSKMFLDNRRGKSQIEVEVGS